MGSALVAIHDSGRWHRLVVAVRGGMRSRCLVVVIRLLTSLVAVHRAPPSVARSCPSNCLASLALRLELGDVEGAGRRTSVRGRRRWCRLSWVRASIRGRVWFSWALVVIWGCLMLHTSLLLLLCGRGILLGRCCRSWTAGVVSPSGLHVALHGVDVVVKQTWIVVGRCVEVAGDVVGVVVVG